MHVDGQIQNQRIKSHQAPGTNEIESKQIAHWFHSTSRAQLD